MGYITIIHPSRSRPQQAMATAKKWIDRIGLSQDEFEYVLSLDADDPSLWGYTVKMPCVNFTRLINPNKSAIEAINVAAEFYSKHRGKPGDFLIVVSDDFDCPQDWGKTLKKAIGEEDDRCYKTTDGIQDWIITLPIMGWKYYNRFGYVYHPSFIHMFSDTFMTCVADLLNKKIILNLVFKHNHYSVGGIKDQMSERADKTEKQGIETLLGLASQNFLLNPNEIVGEIKSSYYLNWIKSKLNEKRNME